MGSKRGQWSSNLGFIIATAGSAIGLGNIWKFPGKVGAGGGGAFILVYFLIVFTLGASLMLTELVVGRNTQKSTIAAFHELNPKWKFVGFLGILAAFIVLSYYSVVGGWVLKYVVVYLTGANFGGDIGAYHTNFVGSTLEPIFYLIIFLTLTVLIVMRGISGGIEKANKILMPALFVLLIVLLIPSVTLDGAEAGLSFLFTVDFSKITPPVLLSALGQALFSLSIGLGTTCTYASYLSKRENLAKNTGIICLLDSFIALLAAFIIIPAVFATDVPLGHGGSFAFTALPVVFASLPIGNFFGALFYVLLTFAALTSAISLLEALVSYLNESLNIPRRSAALLSAGLLFAVGVLYSLSKGAFNLRGVWYTVREGLTFLPLGDGLERLCDYFLIPLGSLGFCIFVGWIWGADNAVSEITQDGRIKFRLAKLWVFTIRYLAPAVIAIIMTLGFMGELKL